MKLNLQAVDNVDGHPVDKEHKVANANLMDNPANHASHQIHAQESNSNGKEIILFSFNALLSVALVTMSILSVGSVFTLQRCGVRHSFSRHLMSRVEADPILGSSPLMFPVVIHNANTTAGYIQLSPFTLPLNLAPLNTPLLNISQLTTLPLSMFGSLFTVLHPSVAASLPKAVVALSITNSTWVQNNAIAYFMLLAQINSGNWTKPWFPNLSRCVVGDKDPQTIEAVETYLRHLNWIAQSSSRVQSCVHSGQQQMVDVATSYKTTYSLFSSMNVPFLVTTVLWISASFSVFRTKAFLPSYQPWSYYSTYFVAVAWNVALLGITFFTPILNDNALIPVNNVLITISMTIAAMYVQHKWSQVTETIGGNKQRNQDVEAATRKEKIRLFGKEFVRMSIPGRTHNDENKTTLLLGFEYAITSPLLVTTLLAAWSPDVTPAELQLVFVAMTMGHFMLKASIGIVSSDADYDKRWNHAIVAQTLAGVMFMITALIIFGAHAMQAANSFDNDSVTLQSIGGFLIATQVVYTLTIVAQCTGIVFGKTKMSGSSWIYDIWHTLLDFIMKVSAGSVVYVLMKDGTLPAYGCSQWSSLWK